MKLAFFAGIIVAFPLLLLFILQFVLPGLHQHEKKVMWPALAIGFGLFLAGVGFAYFFVLPRALVFFHEWSLKLGVSNDWRIGEYITFATQFTLLFGLSFELPVVVMVLVKIGLLGYEAMSRTRAYAILAIVVVAAIITPTPDAFTLCLMAAPMILLYEGCIWLAWLDARKQRRAEEAEERKRMERLLTDRRDDPEGGEVEDRGDHWDPSSSEEGWKAGQEAETPAEESDAPPESIPGEEKRRMSDL
jgi:sec-independent protein translocase protein TatC